MLVGCWKALLWVLGPVSSSVKQRDSARVLGWDMERKGRVILGEAGWALRKL